MPLNSAQTVFKKGGDPPPVPQKSILTGRVGITVMNMVLIGVELRSLGSKIVVLTIQNTGEIPDDRNKSNERNRYRMNTDCMQYFHGIKHINIISSLAISNVNINHEHAHTYVSEIKGLELKRYVDNRSHSFSFLNNNILYKNTENHLQIENDTRIFYKNLVERNPDFRIAKNLRHLSTGRKLLRYFYIFGEYGSCYFFVLFV